MGGPKLWLKPAIPPDRIIHKTMRNSSVLYLTTPCRRAFHQLAIIVVLGIVEGLTSFWAEGMSGSMVDTRSNKTPGKKWPISRFILPELFPSFLSEVSNA